MGCQWVVEGVVGLWGCHTDTVGGLCGVSVSCKWVSVSCGWCQWIVWGSVGVGGISRCGRDQSVVVDVSVL